MSTDSRRPIMNGHVTSESSVQASLDDLNTKLKTAAQTPAFHGDDLLADKQDTTAGILTDVQNVATRKNAKEIGTLVLKKLFFQPLDMVAGSQLVGSLPSNSASRSIFIEREVKNKYEKMLHPPLTYLGDAFQYRAADGKFNSVLHPHLGQAGAPYAKSVPSKTRPLGALPDPGDIFDRLMARDVNGRESKSGLSSMLIYHATIIIHDIFRTNDTDKNISDSSSYLDLSPLYGYTEETQRKVRDDKYKLGLLKPDTFAEDRLLRQPPGVCIMLVMYNRYHNYAATQLRRINENGRFSIPAKFSGAKLVTIAEGCVPESKKDAGFRASVAEYQAAWETHRLSGLAPSREYDQAVAKIEKKISSLVDDPASIESFGKAYDNAWNKLDDDLFNTARLITCGMYVNISIHDYLRALMGFHRFDTNFTLDPRIAMTEHKNVSRGLGNQVTVEFNLLYRFHCAISKKDEKYTEDFMKESIGKGMGSDNWDPKTLSLQQFTNLMQHSSKEKKPNPWEQEFGLLSQPASYFKRNPITGLFDDQQMISQLTKDMEDPISNFGPRNVPRCLRSVELMGIMQARKWEIGTLNDFRDFFGMERHKTFESITKNQDVQNTLRDLYDHPDKVELYPGVFCESDSNMGLDPGPSATDSALWAAIFSDAITLVRSDRFYTVDWNTNSLTSWGMNEVTPDNNVLKSSVFHRLAQRAFPEWFPYDSIRFFHPFYTGQKNAQYAKEQNYAADFKVDYDLSLKTAVKDPDQAIYHFEASEPKKPLKPVYLSSYADVKALLAQDQDVVLNPACFDTAWLPEKVKQVLAPGQSVARQSSKGDALLEDAQTTMSYFATMTRQIVEREVITIDRQKSIYQIDVTRDLAIPVITKFVAYFLGFGDQIKTPANLGGRYSENEIYQHITNCQVFLSYNADETKMLKRRTAFKKSMQFLFDLAEAGNVREANRWSITRGIMSIAKGKPTDTTSHMKNLGMTVAKRILDHEKDSGKAAAIMLLTALDFAYNSVLAFTAVLNHLLGGLYKCAETNDGSAGDPKTCVWLEIQKLALKDTDASDKDIKKYVLKAQRLSVKLPVVRKAAKSMVIKDEKGNKRFSVDRGQTIVCDVYRAMADETNFISDSDHLTYGSSLSQGFVHFNPKETAVLGLTAMIKVLAQMKNLRRGHDAQGRLKKIETDQTYEGYANFMAPMRMQKIRRDVEMAQETGNGGEDAAKVFDTGILKPSADTYLTPEWDEMVPFPTTWKVRFDGYGPSDYFSDPEMLQKKPLPDDFAPFYQPRGPSHSGGSFADTICVCNMEGRVCLCKEGKTEAAAAGKDEVKTLTVDVKTGGCGAPGSNL